MRLINAESYQFVEYYEPNIPPYAILSHRWGDEEVLFADMGANQYRHKAGFRKLRFTCEQALKDGLRFVWVDTCAIDKASSSELSEAINSMFRWYRDAKKCYAFLADVTGGEQSVQDGQFARSVWFERGWTLQELIAPMEVAFYDTQWQPIGSRTALVKTISETTRIHPKVLSRNRGPLRAALDSFTIATRMAWAASRKTMRIEDRAYSLLGLFDINMPLLYGEGQRAFTRLQEEILKSSDDLSILAWDYRRPGPLYPDRVLAVEPDDFQDCSDFQFSPIRQRGDAPVGLTLAKAGLTVENPFLTADPDTADHFELSLGCQSEKDFTTVLAVKALKSILNHRESSSPRNLPCFLGGNAHEARLVWVKFSLPSRYANTHGLLLARNTTWRPQEKSIHTNVWVDAKLTGSQWTFLMHPKEFWNRENLTLDLQSLVLHDLKTNNAGEVHGALALVDGQNKGFVIHTTHSVDEDRGRDSSWVLVRVCLYDPSTFPICDQQPGSGTKVSELAFLAEGYAMHMNVEGLSLPNACIAHLQVSVYPSSTPPPSEGGLSGRRRNSKPGQLGDYIFHNQRGIAGT